jgi:extracellular factor (EF) 3-hydroxypalmitic acid methyl ester biosynthesis protein
MDATSAQDGSAKDQWISYQNSQGLESRATLVRISRFSAVFETYPTAGVLRVSEVLPDFRIFLNDSVVYSGKAVVNSLVNAGVAILCEVQLEDAWQDAATLASAGPESLKAGFRQLLQNWQQVYRIEPDFKAVVADLHAFLAELRVWIDQVELGIRSSPSGDRVRMEQDIAGELAPSVLPAVTALFEKLELAAGRIPEQYLPAHRSFCRKQLHSLVLCSPFLYRTFSKPLGYAGDYEMVNMIVRNPYEGGSLFAKVVNAWFLSQPPAEAHRNRIQHLVERLSSAAITASANGKVARVLSLGCGPAHEVQALLREKDLVNHLHFTLIDFNQETLEHVHGCIEQLKTQFGRKTVVDLAKKSVNQLLKEAAKSITRSPEQQHSVVYCAGLYDYLTDPICRRLSNILYDWVAPGGLLLLTNVDQSNPRKMIMDLVMEWNLLYRTGAQLATLKPDTADKDVCQIRSDLTGVNVYLEARKPERS